jgi:AcrR family transcriptional regulator
VTRPATARIGRPRDEATGRAILAAARGLLAEHGYSDLTMEAVAARAGIAKTTLYRRWTTKADLVVDAVADSLAPLLEPDPATLQTLTAESALRMFVAALSAAEARSAFLALIGEAAMDPVLHDELQARIFEPSRRLVARCGQLDASPAVLDLLYDVVVGAVIHRVLVRGQQADDTFVTGLLSLVAEHTSAT